MHIKVLKWLFAVVVYGAVFSITYYSSSDYVTASLLGVLLTGAGVQTTFSGQAQCEAFIVVGDVDTANPLRGLSVEIDGSPFINIQASLPLMSAFMQWQMESIGATVGFQIKVATGMIPKNTTYRFTNNGVTTPNIFVYSDQQDGVPILATTKGINALSYEDFNKFSALFLTLPASIDRVEMVFNDGHIATMTIEEIDGYFAFSNNSEANGRLTAVSVIDNTAQNIKSCRVFATVAATVLVAKLPNAAFKALQKS